MLFLEDSTERLRFLEQVVDLMAQFSLGSAAAAGPAGA